MYAYFYQLTNGCGNLECSNAYCSTSTSFLYKHSDRNQLVVEAIKLVKEKAPLCQPFEDSGAEAVCVGPEEDSGNRIDENNVNQALGQRENYGSDVCAHGSAAKSVGNIGPFGAGTRTETDGVGSPNNTSVTFTSYKSGDMGLPVMTDVAGTSNKTHVTGTMNKIDNDDIGNKTDDAGTSNNIAFASITGEIADVGTAIKTGDVDTQIRTDAEDTRDKIKKALKQRLKTLFHLIITKHPDAMTEVNDILQTTPDLLKQDLFFLTGKPFFRMKSSSGDRDCSCDWLYESFEWLQTENMSEYNNADYVMDSIDNGMCTHYSSQPKVGKTGLGRPASVQLVHAAAAVGYMPVLGTLLSLYADDVPLTQSNKLTPLEIAVFRNCESSIELIMTFLKSVQNYTRTLLLHSKQCESFSELVESAKTEHNESFEGEIHGNAVLYALKHKEGVGLRGALAMGGDVDSKNEDGLSLLQLALRSADPCVIADILYYNPSAVFTKKGENSILLDAMTRDLEPERGRGYIGSIAMLLLDCGYDVRSDQVIFSSYSSLMPSRPHTKELFLRRQIVKRVKKELFCPKSLQGRCKDTLRKGMPGHTLHVYLSTETLPSHLKDFVLMETRLKRNIVHRVKNMSSPSSITRLCCNIEPKE